MTDHEQLQIGIPALAAGRLAEAEARTLEAHVANCASCAAVLATAREIAALAQHPEVGDLRRHALGHDPRDAEAIAQHLITCASCSLEVAAWQQPKSRARRAVLPAAAALAAALVLWLWLGPLGRREIFPGSHDALQPQVIAFSSAFRSGGQEQVVDLEPGQDLLVRADWESLEPAAEVGPLHLEIVAAGGSPVWSASFDADQVLAALRAGTGFSAVVPAGALETGAYEFRMFRVARPEEPPLIQEPFRARSSVQRQSPDATKAPQ